MRKTFLLIALVVAASCSGGFLSNFREIQHKIDEQYIRQQRLMDTVQDLADAAADNKTPNPQKIADTIDGLTQATKFWGQFVGDDQFDTSNLQSKLKYLQDNQDKFNEYTSTDAKQLMVEFNKQLWGINMAVKSIQSLAVQLKKNAENVELVTGLAFASGEEMLTGQHFQMYKGALSLLYNTVVSGLANTKTIKLQMNETAMGMIQMNKDLEDCAGELRQTAAGKSKKFEDWRDKKRAEVYGGCVASVLCGPGCVALCYGIAAPILENDIADYKKEVQAWTREYNNFAAGFDALAQMATESSTVAKHWYNETQNFENVLQTQYDLINALQSSALVSSGIRAIIAGNLADLKKACDTVLQVSGGRLEEYEKFDAEQDMIADSVHYNGLNRPHVQMFSAEEATAKIHELCRSVNTGNQEAFERCIMDTMRFVAEHKDDATNSTTPAAK